MQHSEPDMEGFLRQATSEDHEAYSVITKKPVALEIVESSQDSLKLRISTLPDFCLPVQAKADDVRKFQDFFILSGSSPDNKHQIQFSVRFKEKS